MRFTLVLLRMGCSRGLVCGRVVPLRFRAILDVCDADRLAPLTVGHDELSQLSEVASACTIWSIEEYVP